MVIGIAFRAFKAAITTEEDRQIKASKLRGCGQFLAAHELLDKSTRREKIIAGPLFSFIGKSVAGMFEQRVTETDARILYILAKSTERADAYKKRKDKNQVSEKEISIINQMIKAYVMFPPFKENAQKDSRICSRGNFSPKEMQVYLEYLICFEYSRAIFSNETLFIPFFLHNNQIQEKHWGSLYDTFQQSKGLPQEEAESLISVYLKHREQIVDRLRNTIDKTLESLFPLPKLFYFDTSYIKLLSWTSILQSIQTELLKELAYISEVNLTFESEGLQDFGNEHSRYTAGLIYDELEELAKDIEPFQSLIEGLEILKSKYQIPYPIWLESGLAMRIYEEINKGNK